MKEETREIRLIEGKESGHYGIGNVFLDAEAGKNYKVEIGQSRILLSSGHFEPSPAELEKSQPTAESLLKKNKDELVKMAVETGASDYISRLTKPQIADYILQVDGRDAVNAELMQTGAASTVTTSESAKNIAASAKTETVGASQKTTSTSSQTKSDSSAPATTPASTAVAPSGSGSTIGATGTTGTGE